MKPHCLMRDGIICLCILHYPMILQANSEGPDQTARMRSLIWAFSVRICPEGTSSHDTAQMHHFACPNKSTEPVETGTLGPEPE